MLSRGRQRKQRSTAELLGRWAGDANLAGELRRACDMLGSLGSSLNCQVALDSVLLQFLHFPL
jgi:hypothetical protein